MLSRHDHVTVELRLEMRIFPAFCKKGAPQEHFGRTCADICNCPHNAVMPVQITIKDVPKEVRNELAVRAASQGKSMQEYLRGYPSSYDAW